MSPTNTPFVLTRFKNASGTFSWRVSGWLHGIRIRKNAKTREAAAAEKTLLEIRAAQAATGLRAATTFLSDAQLREAEDAFRRLVDKPKTLLFYLDQALLTYREPAKDQTLTEAVAAYLAVKNRENHDKLLSISQLNHIRRHLTRLKKQFSDTKIAELTAAQLEAECRRGKACPKTYNNRRGILSTFFKFGLQQEWIVTNPITKLPHNRIAHRRGSARTLTASQVQELMDFVEEYQGGRLVPYFALCLFAGIRPCLREGEASKLQAEQVRLDTGVIQIEPLVAKTGMKRNITIQPNLAGWLRAYPLEKIPLVPPNMQHLRAAIAKRFDLSHDVMRHTFISMFVAKFRSMGEAALQAGNTESIIRKHYLDLKNPAEAEQFFGILPKRAFGVSTTAVSGQAIAFKPVPAPLQRAG